jgi:CelD/BcsL family acetyltransferase involved in cellulose biosynthesis
VTDQSLNLPLDFADASAATAVVRQNMLALMDVERGAWEALCVERLEGNGFFDPGFSLPAYALASGGRALLAYASPNGTKLTGLLPVTSAWRTLKLPLPILVARQPYSPLSAPLLAGNDPVAAADQLLDAAQKAGAPVLMLADLPLEGPAALALREALTRRGATPVTDNIRQRAALDATVDAEDYLRSGMGAKKLKELRRQSHRMADEGEVRFVAATEPNDIAGALDRFLALEASGWKGRRGTGLGQKAADGAFIRKAAADLGARGNFSLLELWLGDKLIASGTLVRQGDHALFFKIAFDEAFQRFSPGVQLTVELTRRCCTDPAIRFVDSTANAGHPMIDHVWRERLTVGDFYAPTGRGRSLFAHAIIDIARARHRLRERAKAFYHAIRSFREERQ